MNMITFTTINTDTFKLNGTEAREILEFIISMYKKEGWSEYAKRLETLKDSGMFSCDIIKMITGNGQGHITLAIDEQTKDFIGFVRGFGDGFKSFYLEDCILDSYYRGQGIADKMMSAFIKEIHLSKYGGARLFSNKKAEHFYKKHGFKKDNDPCMYLTTKMREGTLLNN